MVGTGDGYLRNARRVQSGLDGAVGPLEQHDKRFRCPIEVEGRGARHYDWREPQVLYGSLCTKERPGPIRLYACASGWAASELSDSDLRVSASHCQKR